MRVYSGFLILYLRNRNRPPTTWLGEADFVTAMHWPHDDARAARAQDAAEQPEREATMNTTDEDFVASHAALRDLADGVTEAVPHTIVVRLIADENPVRVWREHRGPTIAAPRRRRRSVAALCQPDRDRQARVHRAHSGYNGPRSEH